MLVLIFLVVVLFFLCCNKVQHFPFHHKVLLMLSEGFQLLHFQLLKVSMALSVLLKDTLGWDLILWPSASQSVSYWATTTTDWQNFSQQQHKHQLLGDSVALAVIGPGSTKSLKYYSVLLWGIMLLAAFQNVPTCRYLWNRFAFSGNDSCCT